MTPTDLKSLRNSLGLSQAALGALLGVDGFTVRRWEMPESANSSRQIPPHARKLIRLLADGLVSRDDVAIR